MVSLRGGYLLALYLPEFAFRSNFWGSRTTAYSNPVSLDERFANSQLTGIGAMVAASFIRFVLIDTEM